MHYDLTDLRLFLAIAEEGSVSRGAQRCHLAPSSASLRIKALEEAVGTPLFRRLARGVEPNAAGIVMMEHVRRCIAQLGQMHADLTPFSAGISNHLTLFANNNAINSWLPDDLLPFLRAHPSVRIALEERLGTDIVVAVATGRADLGVIAIDAEHPELTLIPYREDRFVVIAPAGSPTAKKKSVRFAACLSTPFVTLLNGTALHTYLLNHATALGRQLDVRMQVSGYRAVARLVAAGVGIGIVPESALDAAERRRLAIIRLDEPWAVRHHQLCVQPEALASSALLASLVETLRKTAR
ncbi:HTH-type transcriptional activator CmpR [Cupriavidus laharis]|uniref:HTH-type transcriptional activator CmpR n=1 Tax=Cupriavidus laharis TaxID=151654 RepID=A0ABM8XHQ0_9BURK|nr:LysR family transcriptional regulator [Cupriavidus laharis]CAG9179696.1 HTH-type transcriptional activator CmpR [Cupriavidus laharis]